jgi:hypothetical protein
MLWIFPQEVVDRVVGGGAENDVRQILHDSKVGSGETANRAWQRFLRRRFGSIHNTNRPYYIYFLIF